MFSKSAHKNSSRIIQIDDYSIIICISVTALMVLVVGFLAGFYPLNEPGRLQAVSYIPRKQPLKSKPQTVQKEKINAVVQSVAPGKTPQKKEKPKATVLAVPAAAVKKLPEPAPKAAPILSTRIPAKLENRLETIRGGRHPRYASIVFQFADRADFEQPQIEETEIQLRLKNTTARLRPYRKYKTFDSWVRLRKAAGDLDIRIGVPENFLKISAFRMDIPHRLVINLYDKNSARPEHHKKITQLPSQPYSKTHTQKAPQKALPDLPGAADPLEKTPADTTGRPGKHMSRLETLRGGRHKLYASIVFEFTDRIEFEPPRIEEADIRLRLNNTTTRLRPFRNYKTFDSWVRLKKTGSGLDVRLGIPENFVKMSAFLMETPHRLVVNLYDGKK